MYVTLFGLLLAFCVVVPICLWRRRRPTYPSHHITRPVVTAASTLLTVPWDPIHRTQQPWMPWKWMDRFQANVDNSRANGSDINVLFYGSSITEGFDSQVWNRAFAQLGSANYGISGDSTQHVLWRIQNGEVDNISPRIVVLMIGTNNIGSYREEHIARGVTTIVEELLKRIPNTRVLLLGILPRTNSAATDIVERINAILASRENLKNIRYLNMRDGFYRGNGQFYKELYTSDDLLHINAAGYSKWEELMHPLFYEMWNTD